MCIGKEDVEQTKMSWRRWGVAKYESRSKNTTPNAKNTKKQLTKIPSHFSSAVLRIGKSVFEERIDLPRIAAVHIGLFEENELIRHSRIEVPLAKIQNLGVCSRLFKGKLVAGKGQNPEPPRTVHVKELREFGILGCIASYV